MYGTEAKTRKSKKFDRGGNAREKEKLEVTLRFRDIYT